MFFQSDKVKELESIIRQSERERLMLEKQIQSPVQSRVTSPLLLDEAGDLRQRLDVLENENEELKTTVKKLENVEGERLKLVGTRICKPWGYLIHLALMFHKIIKGFLGVAV